MSPAAFVALLLGGVGIALAAFAWPAAVAIWEAASQADAVAATLSGRALSLLLRGLAVAAAAAILAQLVGIALAAGISAAGRRLRQLAVWACLVVILTPPYIYAYAWSLPAFPEGLPSGPLLGGLSGWLATAGRVVWCFGTWLAPIAAVVILIGWRSAGRPALVLALQDAGPVRGSLAAGLPVMRPWLGLSLVLCATLALTEFSVCHLCLVQTWNTEILAEAQLLDRPGAAFLLGWPLLAILALLALVLWPWRARFTTALDAAGDLLRSAPEGDGRAARGWLGPTLVLAVAIILLLPLALLVRGLHDPRGLLDVWSVYPRVWPGGVLVASGAAAIALWLALTVDALLTLAGRRSTTAARLGRATAAAVIALALLAAAAPPVLVGDAFLAAYARVPVLRDSFLIVSLLTAARFAIIPIALVCLSGQASTAAYREAAAVDGAAAARAYFSLRLPLTRGALIAGGLAVWALALTEVSASQMVTPPALGSLALTLLNAIHFGRSDRVIALCLMVVVVVGLASWVAMAAPRAARQRSSKN